MAAVLRAKLVGQDETVVVELRHGSNVVGKKGGPADVHLGSASLSRRHAMITVGERAEDCSVEDLNSTNKSAILNEAGELSILEPGTIYRLSQRSELVFGDVQAVFEFLGGGDSSSQNDNSQYELIQSPGASTTDKTRPMSGSTSLTQTTIPLYGKPDRPMPGGGGKGGGGGGSGGGVGAHQEAYAHAKNDLGMSMPYDSDLLWIAEASLQMPLPEGWAVRSRDDGAEAEMYVNEELDIETEIRPQTIICRNLYQETKRKAAMEEALGTSLDEEALPRLLLLHPSTGVNLFHYILPGRNVLGKAVGSVDIILESTACSKRHAYLEMRANRFFLADLSSTNGTYVGQFPDTASQQVAPGVEVEVTDGQLLLFGDVECTLSAPEGEDIVRQAVTAGSYSTANAGDLPPRRTPGDPAPEKAAESADGKRGEGVKETVIRGKMPPQGSYDVDEEVRLAEELQSLESQVAERVEEVRAVLGVGKREDPNPIPSRRKGFLARQEARRQKILETAANYYRKQSPLHDLGTFLLPTGSLHRILASLAPIPHLCIVAAACKGLREAAYCTLPWTTVNGDQYNGLWSKLVLSGTRCADGHTLIGGLGPERLGHVITMDLAGIKTITDDTLAVIAEQCPLLTELSLKRRVDIGPDVSDVGLQDIAGCCGKLKVVHLTWCSKLTDDAVTALANNCPNLQILDLSFCHLVTDRGVLAVMGTCGQLEELVLEGCERITEQGIVALAQSARSVKKLSLAGCLQGCTTMAAIQIARSMVSLTHLDLTGLPGLQDAAVWQVSRGCRWLQRLSLAWCVQLTDHSFMQVGKNCPLLLDLNLRGCNKISDQAVVQIAHNCCYLKLLDLRGCEQVSQSGLDAMALMIPSCLVLFLHNSNSSQRK